MNTVVVPTGYQGSGSSAITDLVSEFDGFQDCIGSFEWVFLHCPNGLFDLEDKLLRANNAVRSDEALRAFRAQMVDLYKPRLWWPGNYRSKLSPRFLDSVDRLLDNLTLFTSDAFWYHQQKLPGHLLPAAFAKEVISKLSKGSIKVKPTLSYRTMLLSLPSSEEFYASARVFLSEVLLEMGAGRQNIIADQLLLPFNLWRMDNYFDPGSVCVFVVQRDPRDVFLANKYIWRLRNEPVPFPYEVEAFCDCYRRMREAEISFVAPYVHRIFFEDLVYRYNESLQFVATSLGVSLADHTAPRAHFDPSRSIENTQLFLCPEYRDEATIIERLLPEYLYNFPFERTPTLSASF